MPHHHIVVEAKGSSDCQLACCCCQQAGQPAALTCVSQQENDIMTVNQLSQLLCGLSAGGVISTIMVSHSRAYCDFVGMHTACV
jgi:hypothetical protein